MSTAELESFSAPIGNVVDSYVQTPLFGPNVWVCAIRAVRNGGLPTGITEFDLKFTFQDGGAYDFHSVLERAKENLHLQTECGYTDEEAIGEDLPSYNGAPGYSTGHHGQGRQPAEGPPPGYEEAQMDGLAEGLQNYTARS